MIDGQALITHAACRKRRIKCGEERPICNNCVKSKRNCEGYNQRVVFKDPMNAFRPTGSTSQHVSGNGASFDHMAMHGGPIPHYSRTQSASNSSQTPLPAIRPKPSYQDGLNGLDGVHVPASHSGAPDYAYTRFDPVQITPPYPPSDQPPTQGQLYEARYGMVVNGVHQSNNQQPTDVWPESNAQNGRVHFPSGTSSQNQVNYFQQSGDQTMPSNSRNDSFQAVQYRQRDHGPQRTSTQRSALGGDEWILTNPENKPRNHSAQSVLQHSMQSGWLVNHDRDATINGKSQHLELIGIPTLTLYFPLAVNGTLPGKSEADL